MVSYSDLTDRAAVNWAISEFDRLGRKAFLKRYGYGEARQYFVVVNGSLYDSKAIFGAAYERQYGLPSPTVRSPGVKTKRQRGSLNSGSTFGDIPYNKPHTRRAHRSSVRTILWRFRLRAPVHIAEKAPVQTA